LTGRIDWWHAAVRGNRPGIGAALTRFGLRSAALAYGLGVRFRNAAFDRGWKTIHRVPVPVIGVGNLTLGGTGKTPAVEYIAGMYHARGLRVAVLSRGYGGRTGPNDEAMVLAANIPNVPHLQGKNRVELARRAVAELRSEVLVLDDGFQHRRLHRDLDVLLVDTTRPPMADRLFPGGTLREPATGLRRAGAILLTRCDQAEPRPTVEWLSRRFPGRPVATSVHEPRDLVRTDGEPEAVASLRGKPVAAVSGIGNPAAFRKTLATLGAEVVAERVFPDHHAYSPADEAGLRVWAASLPAGATVVTTQKDLVKLRLSELADRPVRAVRIGLAFLTGEAEFRAAVNGVV
jgi:tetraacyldisaccharide 4'-kinase